MKRLERVKKSLLAHSLGNCAELPLGRCCEYISWLSKFHKLPQEDIGFLAAWACLVMGTLTTDEEEKFWDEYAARKEAGRI